MGRKTNNAAAFVAGYAVVRNNHKRAQNAAAEVVYEAQAAREAEAEVRRDPSKNLPGTHCRMRNFESNLTS